MGIIKKCLIAIAFIAILLAIGAIGRLDHDRYIEVNHTPKARINF